MKLLTCLSRKPGCTERSDGPSNMLPNLFLKAVLPSAILSWTSAMAVPSFNLRTALSATPVVLSDEVYLCHDSAVDLDTLILILLT